MNHKILAVLAVAFVALAAVPCVCGDDAEASTVASGVEIDSFKYTLYSSGKATVTGYSGSPAALSSDTVSYGGRDYKVTAVGDSALENCTSLTSVSLSYVESVEDYAFYICTSLTTVDLPAVTTLSYSAFLNCTSLTSVSIPKAETIGSSVFSGCTSLTSIDLPSAKTISDTVFYRCDGLTTVYMSSVKTIGAGAFQHCPALSEVHIGKGLKKVGAVAFDSSGTFTLFTSGDISKTAKKLTDAGASISASYAWNSNDLASDDDSGPDTVALACVALVAVAAIVSMIFIARKD